jgi:phosphodiesterase/alkaline phosphatase D-like protein
MRRPLLAVGIILTAGSLIFPSGTAAQRGLASEKAAGVHILEGPALESATDSSAIIRWTTSNPGGSDLHYAIVHYGTAPQNLARASRSPNRRNRNHPTMTFRVRVGGLSPGTTYYYSVESVQATGIPDRVKSTVNRFTTRQHP